MYRADDGTLIVVMPAASARDFTNAEAQAGGLNARVESRDIDAATISAIFERATKRDWPGASAEATYGVFFDAELGRVVIEGNGTTESFRSLLEEWPEGVEYREVDNVGRLSRWSESSPIDGGAATYAGPGYCTTGFRVLVSGVARMVTAGHCYSLGTSVWSPGNGVWMGTVTHRAPFPQRDLELIGSASYSNKIYVGGTAGVLETIIGASDPTLAYDNYCFSGHVSGERCNMNVTNLNGSFCDTAGCTNNVAVFVGPFVAQGGDSGSPFYLAHQNSTNGIRGMVFARSGSTMYAEKWSRISAAFGATVP